MKAIVFKKCLSVKDADGRFNPQYDENDLMTVECENVLLSIGQSIVWGDLLKGTKVEIRPVSYTHLVIYFCFEEGEEDGRGILAMLNQLSAHGVDVCWGIHVYAGLESGKICVSAGPRMAGAAGVGIKVIGRGGHGSRPDMSVNPVFCACLLYTSRCV